MAEYSGIVPPVEGTKAINASSNDAATAIRNSEAQIKELVRELSDPSLPLVIDGQEFWGDDKFKAAAQLALNNLLERLQNQSTSILSVLSELYRLEKTISGG